MMTPQERQLIDQLFDRLSQLEREPRDAEAEGAIRDGLAKAPNAIYALVQTALVQDEALRRAGARIEELQEELANAQHQAPPTAPADSGGGFLDRMRNSMFGGGSVPSVRTAAADGYDAPAGSGRPMGVPPGYAGGAGAAPAGGGFGGGGYGAGGYGGPGAGPAGGAFGGGALGGGGAGGSFLGTAAAAAAGTIGGSLLLNSIRGMMGPAHASSGSSGSTSSTSSTPTQSAADASTTETASSSPWGAAGGSSNSDLAQQAGANDVGSRNDGGQQVSTADDGSQGAYQDQDGGDYHDDGDYDDYDDDGDDGDYV